MLDHSRSTVTHELNFSVGFQVLKAVTIKSTKFWDMTPCSPIEFHRSSPKISVSLYRTIRRHMPAYSTLNR
jgi:hypothetical protein